MRIAALLCLSLSGAFAQTPDERPRLDPEIASLLDAARAVEPEYTADILYRVLRSDRVPEQELRDELLEELFELGPRVKHPLRVRSVGPWADSSSGKLGMALDTGLDGLTIQCRAVQQLLASDPVRARALFERIVQPTIAPIACTATTIPSTAIYFDTLVVGDSKWFTPEEREKGVHQRFLLDRLHRIRSPLSLVAASKLLLDTDPTPEEFANLLGAYATAFAGLNPSHRETSVSAASLVGGLVRIIGTAREHEIPEQPLLEIVRGYFVERLSGEACPIGNESSVTMSRTQDALKSLVRLGTVGDAQMVAPFTEVETTPQDVLEGPQIEMFWTTPDEKALLEGARHLLFGGGREYLDVEARQTPEWQYEAHQFLLQVESWDRAAGFNPVVYFSTMVGMYQQLISLIPPGPLNEQALRSYLSFLSLSPMQSDDPVRFLWALQNLLDMSRERTAEDQELIDARRKRDVRWPPKPQGLTDSILGTARASSNAVVALYGSAEKILPLSHGRWSSR